MKGEGRFLDVGPVVLRFAPGLHVRLLAHKLMTAHPTIPSRATVPLSLFSAFVLGTNVPHETYEILVRLCDADLKLKSFEACVDHVAHFKLVSCAMHASIEGQLERPWMDVESFEVLAGPAKISCLPPLLFPSYGLSHVHLLINGIPIRYPPVD